MLMSAYTLIVVCGERPVGDEDCVLPRGDNEAAGHWVRRYRGVKELPSGAPMRPIRAIELASGWYFDSLHVPGVLNDIADCISRWKPATFVETLPPSVPLLIVRSGIWELCTLALAVNSSAKPLRERLNASTKNTSSIGSCFT